VKNLIILGTSTFHYFLNRLYLSKKYVFTIIKVFLLLLISIKFDVFFIILINLDSKNLCI